MEETTNFGLLYILLIVFVGLLARDYKMWKNGDMTLNEGEERE